MRGLQKYNSGYILSESKHALVRENTDSFHLTILLAQFKKGQSQLSPFCLILFKILLLQSGENREPQAACTDCWQFRPETSVDTQLLSRLFQEVVPECQGL